MLLPPVRPEGKVTQLDWAIYYHRKGFAIFPVHSVNKEGQCSCRKHDCDDIGKHPITRHGVKDASKDLKQITEWWTTWKWANIGIATGRISNITVIDVDGAEGTASLPVAIGLDNKPDQTMVVRTGRDHRSYHLYYRYNPAIPNMAQGFLPGLCVKNDGGYVIGPHSRHRSGRYYEFINDHEPMEAPRTLALQAWKYGSGPEGGRVISEEWYTEAPVGQRNATLARLCGSLAASRMPEMAALEKLSEYNRDFCKPPLEPGEVLKVVHSIYRREGESDKGYDPVATEFKPLTMRQFVAECARRGSNRWLIKDWLPKSSIGFLAALPESFKTWILMDLAKSLSTGEPFLGRYPVEETGNVLIIQQEDYAPALLDRFVTTMNLGNPYEEEDGSLILPAMPPLPNVDWYVDGNFHFGNKEMMKSFGGWVRQKKPILVALDPLYSSVTLAEHMAAAPQELRILKRLRDETGSTFLLLHHMAKSHTGSAGRRREKMMGNTLLSAFREFGWDVEVNLTQRNRINLEIGGKVFKAPRGVDLVFNIDGDDYNVEVEEDTRIWTLEEKVILAVEYYKFKTVASLARQLGYSSAEVAKAMEALRLTGVKNQQGFFYRPSRVPLPFCENFELVIGEREEE